MWSGDNYVVPGANPGGGGGGGVNSVTAGTNITVTGTPSNPVVNTAGVQTLTQGAGITITGPPTTPTISASNFRPTYIIYVAPNGNDTTGNGSILNPYASPQQALLFRNAFPASVAYEIFLFPGNYGGNLNITSANTYFTASSSAYGDQKSAILSGDLTVVPAAPSGQASTVVAFTNIEFSLSSFASTTSQPEPNYIIFTNCSMVGYNATHSVNTAPSLATLVQYIDCSITNNSGSNTIANSGAYLKLLRTSIINGSAAANLIYMYGTTPRLDIQYCHLLNTASSQNLNSLIEYEHTGASIQNYCMFNTFQYIDQTMDLGAQKSAINYNHTASVIEQNMSGNTFITTGSTYALKKPGPGTTNILTYGGNFGTEILNRDPGITVTITLTNT